MDSHNLTEVGDDNENQDKIGKCSSGRVEIIVIKGEIAQLEQFLFFPQYFKSSATTRKISLLFGKGLTVGLDRKGLNLCFSQTEVTPLSIETDDSVRV